jgi:hypothetical protein
MDSISDFAENLILNEVRSIQKGEAPPPLKGGQPQQAPAGRDIRNIKVPDSMMKEILGEGFHPQESPTVEALPELVWTDSEQEEKEASTPPSIISESTAQQLVPLLEEVRNLLLEMTAATTSSGSIGVNLAGPGLKTPKEKKNRKSVLKERIKNISRRSI